MSPLKIYIFQAVHVNGEETVVKKEEITEDDPFSDTIKNTTSTTELMDQDPLDVVGIPGKKEKIEDEQEIIIKEELENVDL